MWTGLKTNISPVSTLNFALNASNVENVCFDLNVFYTVKQQNYGMYVRVMIEIPILLKCSFFKSTVLLFCIMCILGLNIHRTKLFQTRYLMWIPVIQSFKVSDFKSVYKNNIFKISP